MRKRSYRATSINTISASTVAERLGPRAVLAIDVAKEVMYGALVDAASRETVVTIKWQHPQQTPAVLVLIGELGAAGIGIEAALEPSGTYGDALRYHLGEAGVDIYRVTPKRVYDARALYDGVSSLHDAKAAAIIGRLHLEGLSQRWLNTTAQRREMSAHAAAMAHASEQRQRTLGKIEALLSRHFPELTQYVSLTDATLPALLAHYGSAEAIAADREGVEALLGRVSRQRLCAAKRSALVDAAQATLGVPMLGAEQNLMRIYGADVVRSRAAEQHAKHQLERLGATHPACAAMRPLIGASTDAIVVCDVGEPSTYSSAHAYLKAFGLNLREHSSGSKQGRLSITKCGPSRARQFLWMASLSLLQREPTVAAYYRAKVARDGGRHKLLATTAVMRKIVLALYHVGQGNEFEPERLFDVSRLSLPETYRDERNRRRVR